MKVERAVAAQPPAHQQLEEKKAAEKKFQWAIFILSHWGGGAVVTVAQWHDLCAVNMIGRLVCQNARTHGGGTLTATYQWHTMDVWLL